MGARERAQGWALSYILLPYPSSLILTSGRLSLMPFVSLAKGSQVLHQHLCVVVQYLFKSLTVFDVTYPEGRHQLFIKSVWSTYLPMECN